MFLDNGVVMLHSRGMTPTQRRTYDNLIANGKFYVLIHAIQQTRKAAQR